MAKIRVLQRGDTLAGVAEQLLGNRALASRLADYNGLRRAAWAVPGQAIQIPTLRDLEPRRSVPVGVRAAAAVTAWPPAPNGLHAITQTFGNIWDYASDDGTPDPKWEADFMSRANFRFPIPLDWDPSKSATGARCHKLIAPLLEAVFADLVAKGLRKSVKTYGGCYNWRMKRGASKPSTHSWGIAIDLNARTNGMGSAGDMDPALVALFESYGFAWGGRWSGANKDPMHFQYCSGY
jgi:hypothetical protein